MDLLSTEESHKTPLRARLAHPFWSSEGKVVTGETRDDEVDSLVPEPSRKSNMQPIDSRVFDQKTSQLTFSDSSES